MGELINRSSVRIFQVYVGVRYFICQRVDRLGKQIFETSDQLRLATDLQTSGDLVHHAD